MPKPTDAVPAGDDSVRCLWQAAIGKVFKLTSKAYGVRKVTYTQVKSVKDTIPAGSFEIDVLVVEIVARVIDGKRTHSNICKEGMLPQAPDTDLVPDSFGEECPSPEFEKVTGAILAYTNTYLEWVMQEAPEDETAIQIPVDLPHLTLTDMEASLVRNSPFLLKDLYIITPNSIRAAATSIQQEMSRASRSIQLADAVDPIYVAQKNAAAESLRAKLHEAQRAAAAVRRDTALAALQLDSLSLALLGKSSATTISWANANPSEEGPVFHLGMARAPLEFVRWAHVSGRMVPPEATASKDLRAFFNGWDQHYTGPDKEGIYPLLRPATE
ncbi:MAG TPA: hypothetical protein VG734_12240 [Lacunisphaera sp.]|nr:hypothetical protein [Lacunisphaera sp.]